eukprot:m.921050 g.921050  ORF g.921050 m.921050 type:complete len:309 (-) comp78216_c0_seq1:147-1073(-)
MAAQPPPSPQSLVAADGRLTCDIFRAVPLGASHGGALLSTRDKVRVHGSAPNSTIRPQNCVPIAHEASIALSRPGLSMATTMEAAFHGGAAKNMAAYQRRLTAGRTPNPAPLMFRLADIETDPRLKAFGRNPDSFELWCAPAGTVIEPILHVERDFGQHVSVSAAEEIPAEEIQFVEGTSIEVPALERFRLQWVKQADAFVCVAAVEWPDWFFEQDDDPLCAYLVVELLQTISNCGSDQNVDDYCAIREAILSSWDEVPSATERKAQLLLMHSLIQAVQAGQSEILAKFEPEVGQALAWITAVCQRLD